MHCGNKTKLCAVTWAICTWAGCMQPPRPVPGVGQQPDTKRFTRDFVGVGQSVPDGAMFEDEPSSTSEPLGDAMYPGSYRSPAAITDAFPRKFVPDGTAVEKPFRPQQL